MKQKYAKPSTYGDMEGFKVMGKISQEPRYVLHFWTPSVMDEIHACPDACALLETLIDHAWMTFLIPHCSPHDLLVSLL